MTQKLSPAEKAGKNLKNLIKEAGLTQEAFAFEFRADASTVRRWIAHGIKDINLILEIAEFFDVDFFELLK